MPTVAHIIRRRHSRKRRRARETRRSGFWLIVVIGIPLAILTAPLLASLGLSAWLYLSAASRLPAPEVTVFLNQSLGATRFYDASGERLIHAIEDPLGKNRTWLKLAELPPHLVSAASLAEYGGRSADQDRFDPMQTLIQILRYIIGMPRQVEDGIAGNLVRESVLPLLTASGLDASLLEIVLVAESKRVGSTESLLEWRLNSKYYGNDAFGIEAAAQVYLGKKAADLNLAESALLAAIGQEHALNPIDAAQDARQRGADLLFQLLDAGLIDKSQFDEASGADLALRQQSARQSEIAPYFIKYARRQAEYLLDSRGHDGARLVARGALRITTALDLDLQLQAECILRAHLRSADAFEPATGVHCQLDRLRETIATDLSSPPNTGALTLIDVADGRIISMVGDAETASHQPSILLQPFVYIDAFLRRDFTPASMVYDLPRSYPGLSAGLILKPANPDGLYRGPMNLRDAMAAALLPPAYQVAAVNGIEPAIRAARALGFNSLDAGGQGLDLLERGGAVSVLDSAYAYSVLAALGASRGIAVAPVQDGLRGRDPVAILRIDDANGQVLWSYADETGLNESVIIQPSAVYMVNDILADADAREAVLQRPAISLRLSRPAAVVDGLSADKRESWTVGYTPDLVLAVHTSRADGAPLSLDAHDRAGSAPVWRSLLEYAHAHLQLPQRDWPAPADIEEFLVCEISGMLPATTSHCPTRREVVPAGTWIQRDHYWQTVEINSVTGQLATVNTSLDSRESVAYFIPPDDILDWWVENGKPLAPSSYSTDSSSLRAKPVRLTSPADYAYVGSKVDIIASIQRPGAQSWQLEYGADVNPDRWFTVGEPRAIDASGTIAETWETALFSGMYTVRLSVTFADGSRETDTKLLTFDNTPPSVKLRTSEPPAEIRYPSQQHLSLAADVSDNLTLDRVEFYHGDALLGVDRDWPYAYEYSLEGAGEITFTALAFDKVGNRAASELALTVQTG
ncbi:MAG: penicillin-binding protein [Chloroflexi bacterium]|nr:penicillin-binding protein [Chloroflexota bacterium]